MQSTQSIQPGQVLAGVGILVGLALITPLIGILVLPLAAASSYARAVTGAPRRPLL